MQAKWSSLLLVLAAVFVDSSSGQQAFHSEGTQNRGLPPIVQASDLRFSSGSDESPQQAVYQQPVYQQNRYQQAAYQYAPNQQNAHQQAAYQQLTEQRWQQMRNEQTARLAAQNSTGQTFPQTNQPQTSLHRAPVYEQAVHNPYAQQHYARRDTPDFPARPASRSRVPQQEDPFRNIEDPFVDPTTDNAPAEGPQEPPKEMILEQQSPFDDQPQQPQDPIGGNEQPINPFADSAADDQPPQEKPAKDPLPPNKVPMQNPFADQDPFADMPVPDTQPENPPTQEPMPPSPPVQEPVPTLPAEPSLPGGILDVPQIPSEMQQAPLPPMQEPTPAQSEPQPPTETYPPEAVVPPTNDAVVPPAEPKEAPVEPTLAPTTPDTQPMTPGQLYPGQIPPAPSTRQPTTQTPMNRSWLDSNVGSPGPYMPQAVPAPNLVQPYQQQVRPSQPYAPPSGYLQVMPSQPYNPRSGYQQAAPSRPYSPPTEYQPMAPAQPYNPHSTSPGVTSFVPPEIVMQPSPMYPEASPAIAGGAAIEPGSYFEQNGASCPTCSNDSSCSSCAKCSSCDDDFGRPFYISIFGGGDYAGDLASDDNQTFLDFDTGGGVGVALGKIQGKNLRTDLEFTYRNSPFGPGSSNTVAGPIEGSFNTYSGMANAYWEFAAFPTSCWKPYFGGGIGFVFLDPTINSNSVVNSDSSFAYQWMAGLNYKFSSRTDLFVEYRKFYANDINLDAGGFNSDIDFETSNVFGGFRLKF